MSALDVVKAKLVLLENVPALMDAPKASKNGPPSQSNFDAVKELLNERGFIFTHSVIDAGESVHIPQRRARLWMAGFRVGEDCHMSFQDLEDAFQDQSVHFLKFIEDHTANDMEQWTLADFLLDEQDSEEFQQSWLPETRPFDDPKEDNLKKTWYDKHQVRWWRLTSEQREQAWSFIAGNPWCKLMPLRQRELAALKYSDCVADAMDPCSKEQIWDLSQNVGRVPTGKGLAPCIMPAGRPWMMKRKRPLTGFESLLLQGADPHHYPALRVGLWITLKF